MINFTMDIGMENNTEILVASCFKYKQLWKPFFLLFKKYWKDCPYKINLLTDYGNYPGVNTYEVGNDISWSDNLIYVLKKIKADKIILFQEDFLIKKNVENNTLRKLIKYSFDNNIGCLRITPCPGPTKKWDKDNFLGIIEKDDNYRVSCQLAIWDKDVLLTILNKNESPSDFEIKGSIRSKNINKVFLSLWRECEEYPGGPIQYVISAISRGEWNPEALELLKKEEIEIDNFSLKL